MIIFLDLPEVQIEGVDVAEEIYTHSPFYGARKIAAQLQREGIGINRKTVSRDMQEMGIAPSPLSSCISQLNLSARMSMKITPEYW